MVTAIIALLASILLPALSKARAQARASVCLSNLKQVGTGLTMYVLSHDDRYPMHSSLKSHTTAIGKPRTRWPDYLNKIMRSEDVYNCPSLTAAQRKDFDKPWAHAPSKTFGGYGYNFQYLGNSRHWPANQLGANAPKEWAEPFYAQSSSIKHTAMTVAVGDTRGSKNGDPDHRYGEGAAAVYVIDPPLGSRDLGSHGSRSNNQDIDVDNLWYEGGTTVADADLVRSAPGARHNARTTMAFCDGHAERMRVEQVDGQENGGPGDNRYYNGRYDPRLR